MRPLIKMTGKETKADIIQLLLNAGASYEYQKELDAWWFRGESKPQLLRHVKIYNANVAAGGDGNLSSYKNDEAHSHRFELDLRLRNYLLTEHGIDEEYIQKHVPQSEGLEAIKKWQHRIKTEHDDFIGHTEAEKEKAFEFMKSLFLKMLKIEPKPEGCDATEA